eukprot:gene21518-28503_t
MEYDKDAAGSIYARPSWSRQGFTGARTGTPPSGSAASSPYLGQLERNQASRAGGTRRDSNLVDMRASYPSTSRGGTPDGEHVIVMGVGLGVEAGVGFWGESPYMDSTRASVDATSSAARPNSQQKSSAASGGSSVSPYLVPPRTAQQGSRPTTRIDENVFGAVRASTTSFGRSHTYGSSTAQATPKIYGGSKPSTPSNQQGVDTKSNLQGKLLQAYGEGTSDKPGTSHDQRTSLSGSNKSRGASDKRESSSGPPSSHASSSSSRQQVQSPSHQQRGNTGGPSGGSAGGSGGDELHTYMGSTCSARPTSGRPSSARPTSGRPMTARPGSARGPMPSSHAASDAASRAQDPMLSYDELIPEVDEEGECDLASSTRRYGGQPHPTVGIPEFEGEGQGEEEQYGGITLDQYMSQMVTTPVSVAATSGLGISNGGGHPIGGSGDFYSPSGGDGQSRGGPDGGLRGASVWRHAGGETSPESDLYGLFGSRHISGQGTAVAMSNSLDLRPGTASADMRSPGAPRGTGNQQLGGFMGGMPAYNGESAPIKETDLGGLSASLFAPSNHRRGGPSVDSGGGNGGNPRQSISGGSSVAHSPDRASARRMSIIGPGGVGPEGGLGSPMGRGAAANSAALSPGGKERGGNGTMHGGPSRGGAVNLGGHGEGGAKPASRGGMPSPGGASAHSGGRMFNPVQQPAERPVQPEPGAVREEGAGGRGHGVHRQVQSARPITRGGAVDSLDPSVWESVISVQLQQRPPSRQKPPNQALHLWSTEDEFRLRPGNNGADSGLLNSERGDNPRKALRPQSAAPGGRVHRPVSGVAVNEGILNGWNDRGSNGARPPSRQKPPQHSLLLDRDREFARSIGGGTEREAFPYGIPSDESEETDF